MASTVSIDPLVSKIFPGKPLSQRQVLDSPVVQELQARTGTVLVLRIQVLARRFPTSSLASRHAAHPHSSTSLFQLRDLWRAGQRLPCSAMVFSKGWKSCSE